MTKYFVNRPLLTIATFLVLLIIGVFSLSNLPLDLLPDISLPTMSILTPYPGASAEDIETTVTKYIESAVATVPNVDRIISTSSENVSSVTISFKWGTNLDAAAADVREKLDLIKMRLPEDVGTTIILKFDLSLMPVLVFGISADRSYPELRQLSDKKIADPLKRIKGVGTIMSLGGLQRQINIDVDRNRLEAYHLPINQVIAMLQASNLTLPVGGLKLGRMDYAIRVPGEYTSIDQISNTAIGNFQGKTVYLKDIAEISDSFKENEGVTRIEGYPGLMLMVQKQSGANTVDVVKAAMAEMEKIEKTLPADVKIATILDGSEFIMRSISNLTSTLFWAFLFVVLTVIFFLRNLRGSLIIALTIPFSLIAAFIYLYFSGSTLNMLSLSSLVIAIGMVVDNAIVVLENIYRHRDEKGESPKEASIFGAGEVASAIIASTVTTLIVFVPIIMVPGFHAVLFKQLAYAISIVLAASLFTALTLTPMLASRIMEVKKKGEHLTGFMERFHDRTEKWFDALDNDYRRLLGWALGNRKRAVAFAGLLFVLSLSLFFVVGTEFIPDMDQGSLSGTVEMPVGTRWEETANVMEKVEKIVKENAPETKFMLIRAGASEMGGMGAGLGMKSGANYGRVMGRLVPKQERKRTPKEIQRLLSQKVLQIPGVNAVDFMGTEAMGQFMGMGKPISIDIYGHDIEKTDDLAQGLKERISKIPGIVAPGISREKGNPEFRVKVDRAKASALGLTMAEIGLTLRNNLYGNAVTKYREAGEEYDVFVRLKEENRQTLQDLNNVFITSRTGKNISLANIAEIEKEKGPLSIQRKNQERVVMVEGSLYGRALGDVISDIQKEIDGMAIPSDISVKISGSAEQMSETFNSLRLALFLGILLVYLVMAAQFESLLDPFIIIFSIPFALVGVIWAMFLTGNAFGVMPFIGMIMVVGVVVNNAIVLVDYTNILRARGIELGEAILTAGRTRLRPILMTTLTTIFGLFPLALSRGEGSEIWSPLGIALIGGLTLSTVVTLVFVPLIYSIVGERIKGRLFFGRIMK
ncbi:hypothetical protein COT42_03585 [Candidatus Saganbacteria bacterium CG08_land_8_20_14_0_20_45_16]|uniref:AcrB/AcrD/AcrF family protein n=1 Tax=Candidatus Saganbacteria bacterium CG08_land_8_20_14_0_20_45_16 TaxID=2014293 RepID=A0A2H0XYU5_UNCSA|nr:MAG: hypothetical protein COT42_03585 [Candidatus Saganbacteria bacterium CG08_land_8_20_14_0_20_45_16]